VLFDELFEYFVLILLCWQNLANQVTEQAELLRRTGEGIQLTANQSLRLEKMAALERSSREQSEKVRLLEAWVEALEQDNSALRRLLLPLSSLNSPSSSAEYVLNFCSITSCIKSSFQQVVIRPN